MDNNKTLELIGMAVDAIRAAYGDFTGLAARLAKKLPVIITSAALILFFIMFIPLSLIQGIFKLEHETGEQGLSNDAYKCLKYKEYWIDVLAAVRTIKMFNKSVHEDTLYRQYLNSTFDSLSKVNTFVEYISKITGQDINTIEDLYKYNYGFLNSIFNSYAGYVYSEDYLELDKSIDYESICHDSKSIYAKNKDKSQVTLYTSNEEITSVYLNENKLTVYTRAFLPKAFFPVPIQYSSTFSDSFGEKRIHDLIPDMHDGIDIFAERNTPVIAVEQGYIKKIGWNSFGGWRILIESTDKKRTYYYAHLENYSERLSLYKSGKEYNANIPVSAGEILGYIGSSGSFKSGSLPGTDTGTPPHLHFQMWIKSDETDMLINPYEILVFLKKLNTRGVG